MVDVAPFRAVRYHLAEGRDLSRVLAPPYDVISDAQRNELYARDPHNIVRIDFGRPEPGDEAKAVYQRAAKWLAEWRASGVLEEDPEASYYVLAQTFVGPDGRERTRTGFFSRALLTPFGAGPILPHERTLKGPKEDRLELYRATRMNLSSIFGAFLDPEGDIRAHLEGARRGEPVATGNLDGVQNELFRLAEPKAVAALSALFRDKKLYIADGHHRYETGLAYRDERRRAAGNADPDAAYERILMFAAAVEDPGMVIFPTHRLVHGLPNFDLGRLRARLAPHFELKPVSSSPKEAFAELEAAGAKGNAFVLVTANEHILLLGKGTGAAEPGDSELAHPALRFLDVSVLHARVLEGALGIDRNAQAAQTNLRYSKSWDDAFMQPARDPAVQLALLMNPTKMAEVIQVAESGQVMPQKSTYFMPKLPSGLVLSPLD